MVEFAIVVPVLLLILLGIIEFGRAYNATISVQAAAREAARELALPDSTWADATEAAEAATPVRPLSFPSPDICPSVDGKATVTIRHTFDFMFLPLSSKPIEATGVMRCGL
jgi:Flp pilus assembly protein TadG